MEKEVKEMTNELIEYYNSNKKEHPVKLVMKIHAMLADTFKHQFEGNDEEMEKAMPFLAKHLVLKAIMAYSGFVMHLYLNNDKTASYFFISSIESYVKIMYPKAYEFLFVDPMLDRMMESSADNKNGLFEIIAKMVKESDTPGQNKSMEE